MGIILDVILIGIVIASAYLGYKKGLVKLGSRLFAGIIAIILTLVLYNPVSSFVIKNTQLDEKIEAIYIERATGLINGENDSENITTKMVENLNDKLKNETIPAQADKVSKYAVYVITSVILFIAVKIILSIVFTMLGFVAELPILKQIDTVGGIAYGTARGLLICIVCTAAIVMIAKINPANKTNEYIQDSYLMKIVYDKIN